MKETTQETRVVAGDAAGNAPGSVAGTGAMAADIGRRIASASEGLLSALQRPVRTSSDLSKATGVNKDIASRFMAALAKRDPLAVLYYLPGVESLRRVSRGARERVGQAPEIELFDQTVTAFEEFVQDRLGGRHALDAMASAWLPEARERFESASRQMAFRAAANLRGIEAEAILNTALIHPGEDPDRYDAVQLSGVVSVRRLRPAVPLMITTFEHRDDTAGCPTTTVDGRPIRGDGSKEEFLPRFGRGEPPALRVLRAGTSSFYQLVDEGLGAGTASDLFFGQASKAQFRAWSRHEGDISAVMEAVEVPAQRLVIDVLLHPQVWPGIDPELYCYSTCPRGLALPYDHTRDTDRVDLLDSVRYIGRGIECCRVAEIPRYLELLEWTCEQRSWDPSQFRVYRCDSRYPVVGVQYCVGFELKARG